MHNELLNKFKGCLIGGAVGDALGYAVEFVDDEFIFNKYGEYGITEYSLINGIAPISADTQMTLFTANGLLSARKAGVKCTEVKDYLSHIYHSYREWVAMQVEDYPLSCFDNPSRFSEIPELYESRAPGRTCISYLIHDNRGSVDNPVNDSKGCGGIMRVAPIGLFFDERTNLEFVAKLGAEAAALTHGHELGYLPAAMLSCIVHKVVYQPEISLLDAITDSVSVCEKTYHSAGHLKEMKILLDKAIELSKEDIDDLDAIRELGEGWVAEETLAIAVYCALKYEFDFEKAIIASVNHSGDSDSTGSVTGNILGAYLGCGAIAQKFKDTLELRGFIEKVAMELYEQITENIV